MSKLRIGVVSSSVFKCPPVGYAGLEMISYQCAKGLAALGHRVTLFAPDGSECPGAGVHHTGPGGAWSERQAYDRYWRALPEHDVIIDHSWEKWSYVLKAEGVLAGPVLGVWHAPVDTMYKELPPVERPCVVLLSDDQRAHFEALHNRPGRTCYNGADPDFYRPMNVPRDGRALFLARFSTIKGPDLAIKACRQLGLGLDLVGDTSITNEPDYFRACAAQCDPVQVRLVGPETRGGCVLRFSQAHGLLHPNMRFREPFGLAPVEAMLCGCPVVSWDNGAMRETVRHGETGYLVKDEKEFLAAVGALFARDASGKVLELPAAVRQRCRDWAASQFSVQAMCERYEALCLEAVQTGGW